MSHPLAWAFVWRDSRFHDALKRFRMNLYNDDAGELTAKRENATFITYIMCGS